MRVEKYFAYAHLPPFLQEVSKPFADCIEIINGNPYNDTIAAIDDLIEKVTLFPSHDKDETVECLRKLQNSKLKISYLSKYESEYWGHYVIREILEANDCAVRAALPD